MRRIWISTLFCLVVCPFASAQTNSWTVSGGYSNMQFEHDRGLTYERSGAYVDGQVLFHVPADGFPLLLGGGVSASGTSNWQRVYATFPDGSVGVGHLDSDVGLFTIEGRAAFPIRIGDQGWFVMPQIGAGLLVDTYSVDQVATSGSGYPYIYTHYHTGAAFAVRPALEAGYAWGNMSAGAEVSYMGAWGGFGRLGSRAEEFRAGAFLRFKF